jgi:Sulfotransferase domain
MPLPDFLIIGSAKSGTTTLHKYLYQHPQIFMTTPKEPSYFANFASGYGKDINWYMSLFDDAKPNQICGEASTPYTHQTSYKPEIPKLIFETIPNVKLIYIMRHPVDRAYSQYLHQIRIFQGKYRKQGLPPFKVPETFEQLIERGSSVIKSDDYMQKIDVIATSKYIDQINLYLKFFPKERFLFLFFEDLCVNPEKVLWEIYNFLEIDNNIDWGNSKRIVANKSSDHQWYIRDRITSPLKSIYFINKIYKLFPKKFRDLVYQNLSKQIYSEKIEKEYLPQPMLPETRQMLLKEFEESNKLLSNFLNCNLPNWNN